MKEREEMKRSGAMMLADYYANKALQKLTYSDVIWNHQATSWQTSEGMRIIRFWGLVAAPDTDHLFNTIINVFIKKGSLGCWVGHAVKVRVMNQQDDGPRLTDKVYHCNGKSDGLVTRTAIT